MQSIHKIKESGVDAVVLGRYESGRRMRAYMEVFTASLKQLHLYRLGTLLK